MKKIMFSIGMSIVAFSSVNADMVLDRCSDYNESCYNTCMEQYTNSKIYLGSTCKDKCCNKLSIKFDYEKKQFLNQEGPIIPLIIIVISLLILGGIIFKNNKNKKG